MTEQPTWLQFYINEIGEELEGIESITQVATAIRDYKESSVTYEDLSKVWYRLGLDIRGFEWTKLIQGIETVKMVKMVKEN